MEFQPITTALSRAVALQLGSGTTYLGTGLQLTISPSAQASNRVVEAASQPIGSLASALGLGLGSSRFLASGDNAAFFSSPALSVVTGGGSLSGNAAARASTTGRNDNTADATAVNIGLANLDVITRGGGVLEIGSLAAPFTASATAASRSLLAPQATPLLTARLSALATVRGLEGAVAPQALGILPTFYGQPKAAVVAAATLNLDPGPTASDARAVADAKGIEGYRVFALAPGAAAAPGTPSQVSGMAAASLDLNGAPPERGGAQPSSSQPADLTATAIGIDHADLRGPGSGAVNISGSGLAILDAASAPPPGSLRLNSLQGIGILAADIQSNGGAPGTNEGATVMGMGGFAAPRSGGFLPTMDSAGIDRSTILTGTGNDVVMGLIYSEQDTGLDANGDGVISPTIFLDASALRGGAGGFDGIRNSTINTGLGGDAIYGSASASSMDTAGDDDVIRLDRARDSTLMGGFGDDLVQVVGPGLDNSLMGGFGNDTVMLGTGQGNRLDGGMGQDLVIGPASISGSNTYRQSNAGAALDAATRSTTPGNGFAERLADPDFWTALGAQKSSFWSSGSLVVGNQTFLQDTFSNFDAARGDLLDLSSTLGSLTQTLWESQGALFDVQQGGQLVVREGPANSQIGMVVGTLGDIRSLGIGSPSLAYATDTHQLMFDADGDWTSGGSRSIGTLNMAGSAPLAKANIQFSGGG